MNIYGLTFSQLEDYLIASGEKITKRLLFLKAYISSKSILFKNF